MEVLRLRSFLSSVRHVANSDPSSNPYGDGGKSRFRYSSIPSRRRMRRMLVRVTRTKKRKNLPPLLVTVVQPKD